MQGQCNDQAVYPYPELDSAILRATDEQISVWMPADAIHCASMAAQHAL